MSKANTKKKESTSSKDKASDKESSQQAIDVKLELNRLKRVVYLTDLTPRYIAGNPELFFLRNFAINLSFVGDILAQEENVQAFVDVVKKANNDPNLPRRVTLFYVLAYALRNHTPKNEVTNQLADTVLEICKTDEEFFKFISVFSMIKGRGRDLKSNESYNKITTSMSRIIRKFLEKKTPSEYAKAVASTKGHHSWQYKDLIKLSHYKSETAEKLLVTDYVLHGMENLLEPENNEMKEVYEILQEWEMLRHPSTKIEKICDLIVKLKATYRNINPKYIKEQQVWAAIIPQLPIEEVMQFLPKFLKYDMLEPQETSLVHAKVMEALSIPNIRSAKVNPLEIFIHLKNFQKGGKPIDPKLEHYLKSKNLPIKVPASISEDNSISKILYKCFLDSYPLDTSVLGLSRNVMIVLDVAQYDSACFKQRNITCLEGAVALTTYFSKSEKQIDITVFDGETLEEFDWDNSSDSFNKNLKKLKEVKPSKLNLHTIFDWTVENEKNIDLFICFIQSAKSLPTNPKDFRKTFKEAYKNYQTKTLCMDIRIITICLGSHNLAPFPECINSLTICGFCPEIPKVIHSFVNGDLHQLKSRISKN
ncbi:60 kDa SS-A/Ro ribonucleoprotein-like isoform X1 [Coccinella septempunctata]|uniref:60 kDa SS-A/Ro ribonucleoprotein-like isoform X1 n=1 Tax=Coccinella septempunctata TaxID=41139 RepID=UPI001D09492B|nr:60 kDa SS-A/Ro ribonucleoprotein-like isoform X1 [Coccinella septempunctata]XP_044761119.1 60 kDa SS-A/Ro ribonucleoprotein-like isoform X1 [Coccinella septempunctata]XP_044761120.1 60 kDa SS-A/Ro ribonucleoprotein-like isoform X1 [Coccinella septempunctata]XP_044761122.1 60 kDa SS-A/Ro ribonucleoprotein-like isoform X1 [Coccinella septempunctata]